MRIQSAWFKISCRSSARPHFFSPCFHRAKVFSTNVQDWWVERKEFHSARRLARARAILICLFVWLVVFFMSLSITRLYRGKATLRSIWQFLGAATLETELGNHDFCLNQSHYTDTDPTSRERAASPGVARSTDWATAPPSSCWRWGKYFPHRFIRFWSDRANQWQINGGSGHQSKGGKWHCHCPARPKSTLKDYYSLFLLKIWSTALLGHCHVCLAISQTKSQDLAYCDTETKRRDRDFFLGRSH